MESELSSYRELGTVEELKAVKVKSDESTTLLAQYLELGTVAELDEAITGMITFSDSFKDIGSSVEEVSQALSASAESLMAYKELGTIAEIKETLSAFSQTMEDHKEMSEELNTYRSFGSLEDLKEIEEAYAKEEKDGNVKALSEKFDVSPEFAAEMLEKFGTTEDAEAMIEKFAGSLKKSDESAKPVSTDPKTLTVVDEFTDSKPTATTASRLKSLLGVK